MIRLLLFSMSLMFMGACASQGMSPRQAAMNAADKIEPALIAVVEAKQQNLLPTSVDTAIAEYGPRIRAAVGGAMEQARYCIVTNGNLTDDDLTGGDCKTSRAARSLEVVSAELTNASLELGAATEEGTRLRQASFLVGIIRNRVATGLRKEFDVEEDVTLADYDARMFRLQQVANQLTPDIPDG